MKRFVPVIIGLLAAGCQGESPAPLPIGPTPTPTPMVSFANLSGTVTDAVTGQPLADVRVFLPESWNVRLSLSATTDANGQYRMTDWPAHLTHWVVASKSGFFQQCAAQVLMDGDTTVNLQLIASDVAASGPNVVPRAGPGTRNATGYVYRNSASGRVPVSGAFVAFGPLLDNDIDFVDVATTVTDSTGRFALCGLPQNQRLDLHSWVGPTGGGANFAHVAVPSGTADASVELTFQQ